MSNLFNIINIIKRKRQREKKLFQKAKSYLKSGVYYYENAAFFPFSLQSINLHRFFHLYINLYNKKSRLGVFSKSKYAECKSGYAKDLFLYEEYAVGFFKNVELYEKANKNYQNNISDFPYSVVNVIGFDDERNSIVMERVNGVQYDDKEHDQLIISRLFEYAIESPIKKSEIFKKTYLQHGDAKRNNIIWTSDSNFVFIDIDNISYRPLLFDVLHYCAMADMDLEEVLSTLDLHKSSIKELFLKCDLCFNESYIDSVFYYYVLFFIHLDDCFEDIDFLIQGDLGLFPRTSSLISKRVLNK